MGDVMNFPERIEDFIEQYSFRDDERTYTNGSKLIPVFRVKQAIEHYMTKWIPCSERLPKEPKTNPVLEGKNLELYLVTTEYGSNEQDKAYPFRAFWNGVNFTDGWHILDVIAWQPLPEPYRPNDEQEKKQTNADRIRSMSDEELTDIILCPYDTAGKQAHIMPCVKDGNIQELVSPEYCKKCMMKWLQSEVEE